MPVVHPEEHPLAGHKVIALLRRAARDGIQEEAVDFTVEDWADRVWGDSWGAQEGNPTAILYGIRIGVLQAAWPGSYASQEAVLYGKVNGLAQLFHVEEIEDYGQ